MIGRTKFVPRLSSPLPPTNPLQDYFLLTQSKELDSVQAEVISAYPRKWPLPPPREVEAKGCQIQLLHQLGVTVMIAFWK